MQAHLNMNQHIIYSHALTYEECKTSAQKVQFHKENGDRCYADAKERCWWLPIVLQTLELY